MERIIVYGRPHDRALVIDVSSENGPSSKSSLCPGQVLDGRRTQQLMKDRLYLFIRSRAQQQRDRHI